MPDPLCAAVVLAAGASTRLGEAKQLIEIDGETLLRRSARLALNAGCSPVVVVLGSEAERMRAELRGLAVEAVVNPNWREGMGSSVRCGVESVGGRKHPPQNLLLLVCDQPRLTAEHLRSLLARHATGGLPITASEYAGRTGVPAVFAATLVPELLQCAGDQGARDVIRRNPARVQAVSWPDGAVDIDRPQDLEALAGSRTSGRRSVNRSGFGGPSQPCDNEVEQPMKSSAAVAPPPATITPELLAQHGITADEYRRIEDALGRTPSLTELGIYSVMWSEHCSYKSSKVHLKRLPTRSKLVVQGPGENAGIIDVGDGWACAFKIESHNHPSYIEPFQGAATGVGGILRDIFTMGARPLAVMDSLRFGPLTADKDTPEEVVRKNHSVVEGVVHGIAGYGNCFGVPNLGGETKFEPCYSGNPLVNAFALGLVRRDEIFYAKASGIGNPVIYVGARTGRDGIHGATMASEEFKEGSEQKRPNVQVGDPFMEKLLLEACLEAMQTGAVVGIQDMGAAGLTSSSCEMGGRGGVGIEMDLDQVPQRETGMTAYEMMLSESQERMLLVAEKGREPEVLRVFEKWGLEGVIVGTVIEEPQLRIFHHGELVADIPNRSLTDECPLYSRPVGTWARPEQIKVPLDPPAHVLEELKKPRDYTADLKKLLASANICSKRWVYEQYDSMVQTNTVQGPGGEAGVMRIKGTGTPGHERGLAMALAGNGRWCYLDPKLGAMHAVAEAARKVACTGATPVAATNCLNFGNPEKPEIMAQFSAAIDGIAEACTALGTPITGGNVSLYNETKGEGIYPTPVVGVVGLLEDVTKAVPAAFQRAGDDVLLLIFQADENNDPSHKPTLEQQFGSSEFAKAMFGALWGVPPGISVADEANLHRCLADLADQRLIHSAADVADGGVYVTVAKSCFANLVGFESITETSGDPKAGELAKVIWCEMSSTAVVSCAPSDTEAVVALAQKHGATGFYPIGKTIREGFKVEGFRPASIAELSDSWSSSLESQLAEEVTA